MCVCKMCTTICQSVEAQRGFCKGVVFQEQTLASAAAVEWKQQLIENLGWEHWPLAYLICGQFLWEALPANVSNTSAHIVNDNHPPIQQSRASQSAHINQA